MTQSFDDNLYLIDLSYLNTPSEVVYDLSTILDTDLAKNQRVKLKLGNVEFNKSQLLSIKSLIESINSTLAIVDSDSEITKNSAISIGLVYQKSEDNPENSENPENNTNNIELIEPQFTQSEELQGFPQNNVEPQVEEKKIGGTFELQPQMQDDTPIVQSFEQGFANNNWAKPEIQDLMQTPNTNANYETTTPETLEEQLEDRNSEILSELIGEPKDIDIPTEHKQEFQQIEQPEEIPSESQEKEENTEGCNSQENQEPQETQENQEFQGVSEQQENNETENTQEVSENVVDNENQENTEYSENSENTEEQPVQNEIENEAENQPAPQPTNHDITIREEKDFDFEQIDEPIHDASALQSLADIPLDIPNEKEIQNELDVIYSNTERKLDDVFAKTGLKEEKFQSIKETAHAEEREYTQYDFEIEAFPTKYLKQTICAGQFISFEGNLVIIGDCHEGSEIAAAGDITVWGELSGSVHAGKNGNEKSKIRALHLNATQIRIANCYVKRKTPLNTDIPTPDEKIVPEEAKISKGEIEVYKIFKYT